MWRKGEEFALQRNPELGKKARCVQIKMAEKVLASVVQLAGCHPASREVTGLMPGQGMCLGCECDPSRGVKEWQPTCFFLVWMFISLSFSPPSPLSKINKHVLR